MGIDAERHTLLHRKFKGAHIVSLLTGSGFDLMMDDGAIGTDV